MRGYCLLHDAGMTAAKFAYAGIPNHLFDISLRPAAYFILSEHRAAHQ